jgi:hypothetical protein
MENIKNNYTNFILTVIAVAMIGILFKGEKIITSAHAIESHQHHYQDIGDFEMVVKALIKNECWVKSKNRVYGPIFCDPDIWENVNLN